MFYRTTQGTSPQSHTIERHCTYRINKARPFRICATRVFPFPTDWLMDVHYTDVFCKQPSLDTNRNNLLFNMQWEWDMFQIDQLLLLDGYCTAFSLRFFYHTLFWCQCSMIGTAGNIVTFLFWQGTAEVKLTSDFFQVSAL